MLINIIYHLLTQVRLLRVMIILQNLKTAGVFLAKIGFLSHTKKPSRIFSRALTLLICSNATFFAIIFDYLMMKFQKLYSKKIRSTRPIKRIENFINSTYIDLLHNFTLGIN